MRRSVAAAGQHWRGEALAVIDDGWSSEVIDVDHVVRRTDRLVESGNTDESTPWRTLIENSTHGGGPVKVRSPTDGRILVSYAEDGVCSIDGWVDELTLIAHFLCVASLQDRGGEKDARGG